MSTNPRRRAARNSDSSAVTLLESFSRMSIRKGETFHPNTNTSKSSFWDPLERLRSPVAPMRSSTSPKSLEDLLMGSGERRITELLDRVDQAVAANSKVALSNVLSEPEVLPLPAITVDGVSPQQRPIHARTRHHSHSSDSGIGSSIADSSDSVPAEKQAGRTGTHQTAPHTRRSALTFIAARSVQSASPRSQSFSSISDAADEERGLSKYAAEQIQKHVVHPILSEVSLKDFHGLIKSIPARISDKEIKNLRDLEKTLIYLAPDYSHTPSKYLQFCERTIRVLHTTVTTLHESDQRAPIDRPYTQGYFFDLVDQIRRYATILAAIREKQAVGVEPDMMDVTENSSVSLLGGMTQNGKPAELAHHTADGKVISLATGHQLSAKELAATSSMKRAALDIDDDDVQRSMARRKKNAKPEIHTCELCSKEFKRPCDLTKHVKTHERPWKCPEQECKYHQYGWPTEKERDRHVNDKHSSAPSMYKCLFDPCPYTSKRESNCKQHMEKAHGWEYVRSKSNGKGRASLSRLPRASVSASPSSTMLTPLTPVALSPSMQSASASSHTGSRRSSMAPVGFAGPSNCNTPAYGTPSSDFAGHFNMEYANFDFNDMANFPTSTFPPTPALSEERRASTSMSTRSMHYDSSAFGDVSPQQFTFTNDDFAFPENWHQSFTPNSSINDMSSGAAHLSPGAQAEQTFTEDAIMDGGYGDYSSVPAEDFTLFGSNAPESTGGAMFPTLPSSSWGNVDSSGSSFGSVPAAMPSGSTNAALEELFPELSNSR